MWKGLCLVTAVFVASLPFGSADASVIIDERPVSTACERTGPPRDGAARGACTLFVGGNFPTVRPLAGDSGIFRFNLEDTMETDLYIQLGSFITPQVDLDSRKRTSNPFPYTYDIELVLNDQNGNPVTPVVPVYSQTCTAMNCGFRNSPSNLTPELDGVLFHQLEIRWFTRSDTPIPLELQITRIELYGFQSTTGIVEVAELPEPSTIAVFGIGLAGLAIAARRKRHQRRIAS